MMSEPQSTPHADAAPVIDFDKFKPTRSYTAARKRKDMVMRALIILAFVVALIPLISVLWTTLAHGIRRLNWDFLSHNMTNVIVGRLRRHPPCDHRHVGDHAGRDGHLDPDRRDVRGLLD